ncbi:methyltransferase [Bacillus phage 031MP004]|nr:methyltransferase [Bacillus phage 022DV001]QFG05482.1 methyltransferase [Bacillus phage 031MP003]QFG05658.1 methyltransferase [Bacillus phage 031MP004]
MKYNDPQRIENFNEYGVFPEIHDDIIEVVKMLPPEPTVDIGASVGLLTVRLGKYMPRVIGVEGNAKDFCRAIKGDNVSYLNYYLNSKTLRSFGKLMKITKVRYAVARRVFPEIYDKGGLALVQSVGETLYNAGIEKIILEGRVRAANSKHLLKSADKECEALKGFYTVERKYKNVRVLKRRER